MECPPSVFGSNVGIKMAWFIFVCNAFIKLEAALYLSSYWSKFMTCFKDVFCWWFYKQYQYVDHTF